MRDVVAGVSREPYWVAGKAANWGSFGWSTSSNRSPSRGALLISPQKIAAFHSA